MAHVTQTREPRAKRPATPLRSGREAGTPYPTVASFLSPSLIGLAVFTLLPIAMALVMAFFDWPAFGSRSFIGLDNFRSLAGDPVFRAAVRNTLVFVVLYVPLNIVVSMVLAAWMSPRIRGRQFLRVLFFLPVITPMVANAVVWRLLYQPGGSIDGTWEWLTGSHAPNFLGDASWAMVAVVVMSVWQGFGYNMIVFSAAIEAVPESVTEAARIDGAGPVRTFFSVVLPMISPAIFFATTMTVITSMQVFVQPFLLTGGGPGTATETLVMYIYQAGFSSFSLGLASAASWVLLVIVLGLTAVQFRAQRRWVSYDV
ncbi:carbohydrate ABC transporter permease [Flexivirga meconopsidis]|uniref:carbohydrate ABC transporter permease n=1 Tax=Flexivirga meconopsidis TaxID=2977121 RepID=UPI002240DED3|nr:sugar ABC transporter permease [Flexivirga meconopsidis]